MYSAILPQEHALCPMIVDMHVDVHWHLLVSENLGGSCASKTAVKSTSFNISLAVVSIDIVLPAAC